MRAGAHTTTNRRLRRRGLTSVTSNGSLVAGKRFLRSNPREASPWADRSLFFSHRPGQPHNGWGVPCCWHVLAQGTFGQISDSYPRAAPPRVGRYLSPQGRFALEGGNPSPDPRQLRHGSSFPPTAPQGGFATRGRSQALLKEF